MTLIRKPALTLLLLWVFLSECQRISAPQVEYITLFPSDIALCGSLDRIDPADLDKLNNGEYKVAFDPAINKRLIGQFSDVPLISANDNRVPAGRLKNNILHLDLEVKWADFRIENSNRAGLRVVAIGESGKSPTVPAPLIRVETGTKINARVTNTLKDSSITVYGLQSRPSDRIDSLTIEPGKSRAVSFEAGEDGTYFYWVQIGKHVSSRRNGEEDQLSGAFIIDPEGGSPPDRIFVMNLFSTRRDTAQVSERHLEALTINGKSWPYTERLRPNVGDTLIWRIINANSRNHPMHLHGFYYDVISVGNLLEDSKYSKDEYRTMVTEFMTGRTTMVMKWVASRPGNWLFHCHASVHVTPEIRLPGVTDFEKKYSHMAGLVLGIQIPPGPSDLISKGEPRYLSIRASEYGTNDETKYQLTIDSESMKKSLTRMRPGPMLLLKKYQDTYITLENNMSIATGIHWHGLEVDSWADGVPDWSSSKGITSPTVFPGERFTYKLSLMRAGSFIYHSHLDDVHQLTRGLYGPMIVLDEGETFDPTIDHIYLVGWSTQKFPNTIDKLDINGLSEQPEMQISVGETHRLRLMHIAPIGVITAQMKKGDQVIPLKLIAKDGADVPEHQEIEYDITPRYGVGETADYSFTPSVAGRYELFIGYPRAKQVQVWIVSGN